MKRIIAVLGLLLVGGCSSSAPRQQVSGTSTSTIVSNAPEPEVEVVMSASPTTTGPAASAPKPTATTAKPKSTTTRLSPAVPVATPQPTAPPTSPPTTMMPRLHWTVASTSLGSQSSWQSAPFTLEGGQQTIKWNCTGYRSGVDPNNVACSFYIYKVGGTSSKAHASGGMGLGESTFYLTEPGNYYMSANTANANPWGYTLSELRSGSANTPPPAPSGSSQNTTTNPSPNTWKEVFNQSGTSSGGLTTFPVAGVSEGQQVRITVSLSPLSGYKFSGSEACGASLGSDRVISATAFTHMQVKTITVVHGGNNILALSTYQTPTSSNGRAGVPPPPYTWTAKVEVYA